MYQEILLGIVQDKLSVKIIHDRLIPRIFVLNFWLHKYSIFIHKYLILIDKMF